MEGNFSSRRERWSVNLLKISSCKTKPCIGSRWNSGWLCETVSRFMRNRRYQMARYNGALSFSLHLVACPTHGLSCFSTRKANFQSAATKGNGEFSVTSYRRERLNRISLLASRKEALNGIKDYFCIQFQFPMPGHTLRYGKFTITFIRRKVLNC